MEMICTQNTIFPGFLLIKRTEISKKSSTKRKHVRVANILKKKESTKGTILKNAEF